MRNIILSFFGNLAGLFIASSLLSGFTVEPRTALFVLALLLTILHLIVKPILKFFAWPLVVLTLGLALILINAAVLAILDFIAENLTISGLSPLMLGTLIVTGVNLIIHFIGKNRSNS